MKKVCVSGCMGFIGSHLTGRLLKDGYEVTGIDNCSTGKWENLIEARKYPNFIFIKGDIRDLDLLLKNTVGIDTIFHTAAKARIQPSIKDPLEWNDNNVSGTLNVLWAAKENKVRRVVYSASSSAYGEQKTMPLKETMIPNPKSPYALQKYVGELYCKIFSELYGLETISLRYFNVYGKRQTTLLDGVYATVIGIFLGQKEQGKPLTIVGDGTKTRDFTFIDDIVEANIRALKSQNIGKGEVINVGFGKNHSIKYIAELIGGKDYPIKYLPDRIEAKNTLADNSKCQKLLNFKPKVPIEEGIKRCINQK